MTRRGLFVGMAAFATAVLLSFSAVAADHTDVFTVSVSVDAKAASASAARDAARIEGQHEAYTKLLDRLTLVRDHARLPPATDTVLDNAIKDFEVTNERHSSVRYLADYTFHFRADVIEQLLRSNNIPFAVTRSRPLVVLAVLETPKGPVLWDDPNPWRRAWANATLPQGLVPLLVPLGDIEDVTAIDGATADNGDNAHLQAISNNYGGADVLVTRATLAPPPSALPASGTDASTAASGTASGGAAASGTASGSAGPSPPPAGAAAPETANVTSTRFVPGDPGAEQTFIASYTARPGESEQDFLARVVAGTADQVEDAWKQANIIDYSQSGVLVVSIPIDSLTGWIALRDRLEAMPSIQQVELLTLGRRDAQVALHYVGDSAQLRLALAQHNLDLSGSDPNWVLQRRTAAPPSSAAPQGAASSTPPSSAVPQNPAPPQNSAP